MPEPEQVVGQEAWQKYGILINTTQPPIKKRHICYTVKKSDDFGSNNAYFLFAVVEVWYPHPQAPEEALIPQILFEKIGTFDGESTMFPAIQLLDNAQKNMQQAIPGATR